MAVYAIKKPKKMKECVGSMNNYILLAIDMQILRRLNSFLGDTAAQLRILVGFTVFIYMRMCLKQ